MSGDHDHLLRRITPTQLSGGVKTLLPIYFKPVMVFNASTCGNNCAWWILRIAANSRQAWETDQLSQTTCQRKTRKYQHA